VNGVFEVLTIGITGGIGSGKSTVVKILAEYGARVIFADELAKTVMEPSMPAYERIVAHFGTSILDDDKRIDSKKLGEIVFGNKQELLVLNKITHGIVAEKILEILRGYRKEQVKLAVVEAIVPVRHGFLDAVDTVWVVVASEPVRVQRIMKRNNFSQEEALARIRMQMPDEEYKSIANQIIYNDGTVDKLRAKIRGLLAYEQYSPS
jgi:dephospho-CoA kinase